MNRSTFLDLFPFPASPTLPSSRSTLHFLRSSAPLPLRPNVPATHDPRPTIHGLLDPRPTIHDPRPSRSTTHDPRSTASYAPRSEERGALRARGGLAVAAGLLRRPACGGPPRNPHEPGLTPDHERFAGWGYAARAEAAQARPFVIDGVEVDSQSGPGILMHPVLSLRGRRTMCVTRRMPPAAVSREGLWR